MWLALPLLLAAPLAGDRGAPPTGHGEAGRAAARAEEEALSVEIRGLLVTRAVCLSADGVAQAEALLADGRPSRLPALQAERVRLLAACGGERPCVEAVEAVRALDPADPALVPALDSARLDCEPDTVRGLWLESLALEHAGFSEEAMVYRDDALAYARAADPTLLPLLDVAGLPERTPAPGLGSTTPSRAPWTCLADAPDPRCAALGPCIDAVRAARALRIEADPGLPQRSFDAALTAALRERSKATQLAFGACAAGEGAPAERAARVAATGVAAADLADALEASTLPPYLEGEALLSYRMALGDKAHAQREQATHAFEAAAALEPSPEWGEAAEALRTKARLARQAVEQQQIRFNLAVFGRAFPDWGEARRRAFAELRERTLALDAVLTERPPCLDEELREHLGLVVEQAKVVVVEQDPAMALDILPFVREAGSELEARCPGVLKVPR